MASWKKVVVSGSSPEFLDIRVDNLTNGQVVIGGGAGSFLSTTPINGTGNILATTGANNVSMTGSFTGSFTGDGSQLSGLVSFLAVSSSDNGTNDIIQLKTESLNFSGTTNEVDVTVNSGTNTIQIGLTNDVVVAGDLTVDGGDLFSSASTFNLLPANVGTLNIGHAASNVSIGATTGTVTLRDDVLVQGDLTVTGDLAYLNVTNLYVEDKFVLLNSGSVSPSDGGIIVAQTSDTGKALVYDSDTDRWGFTGSLAGSASSVAPDAFVATVIDKNVAESIDVAVYQKPGNIRVETNGDIFIYS